MSGNNSKTVARWIRRVVLAVIAIALVGGAVVALMPKPVSVEVATATRGPMRQTVTEDGKTRVKHRYVISAPLTGNMPRLVLMEGDTIEAEQAITRIVPVTAPLLDERTQAEAEARLSAAEAGQRQARAHVRQMKAGLTHADSEAKRERRLFDQGISSETQREAADYAQTARELDLAAAVFGEKMAAQNVQSARAALGLIKKPKQGQELQLTAPVSGQVLRVLRRDAGIIAAGTPVIEFGDPATLEVVADVLTRDAVHVGPGASVAIVRWGGDAALSGHVHRVEPAGFTRLSALGVEEQRVNVIIDLDSPPSGAALGDAYRVEVEISIWEGSDALSVPASAVFRHKDGWGVYAVDDDHARLQPVTIGHENDERVEILDGLLEGARLVVNPSDRVVDGVEVVDRGEEVTR